jgi:Flp pilus assembly protein TadD
VGKTAGHHVEEAVHFLRTAPEVAECGLAQYWLAALTSTKREAEGLDSLLRAVELEPQDSMFVRDAARWLCYLGRGSEAEDLLRRATRSEDCDRNLLIDGAVAYAEMGQKAAAERLLHRFLSQPSTDYEVFEDAARVFAGIGCYEDALSNLERACELRSQSPSLWHAKGDALLKLGRREEARGDYLEALRLLEGVPGRELPVPQPAGAEGSCCSGSRERSRRRR